MPTITDTLSRVVLGFLDVTRRYARNLERTPAAALERLRALERPDARAERGGFALRLAPRRLGSVEARARLVQRALGGAQRQAEL